MPPVAITSTITRHIFNRQSQLTTVFVSLTDWMP